MFLLALLLTISVSWASEAVGDTCFKLPRKSCKAKKKDGCKWTAKTKKCSKSCKALGATTLDECHTYKGCSAVQNTDGDYKTCKGMTAGAFELEGWEKGLKLGTTDFTVFTPTNPVAKTRFEIAFKMLQMFFYNPSAEIFGTCREDDPDFWGCHWGLAMNQRMPLWVYENVPRAREVLREMEALDLSKLSDLEYAYVNAARVRFGLGSKLTRQRAFVAVMDGILEEHPNEIEAMIFKAFEIMDMTGEGVDAMANVAEARKILWEAFDLDPANGGIAHALTHAYDIPDSDIPEKMVTLAGQMAEIAPDALHMVHMPTHLYDRLSMWKRSYITNVVVVEATDSYCVSRGNEKKIHSCERGDRFHAYVFLHNSLFQLNEPELAMEFLDRMANYVDDARKDGEEYYHSYYQRMWARQVLETSNCGLKYRAKTGSVDEDGVPDMKNPEKSGYWDYLAEAAALLAFTWQHSPACKKNEMLPTELIELIHPRFEALRKHGRFIEDMIEVWKTVVTALAEDDLAILEKAANMRSEIPFSPSQPTLAAGINVWDIYGQAVLKKKAEDRYESALDAFQKSLKRYNKRLIPLTGGLTLAKHFGDEELAAKYQKILESDDYHI